jgi:hypothetical protein
MDISFPSAQAQDKRKTGHTKTPWFTTPAVPWTLISDSSTFPFRYHPERSSFSGSAFSKRVAETSVQMNEKQ